MKTKTVYRKISFIILAVYLCVPIFLTLFFKSTGNLGLTFFGTFTPISNVEGLMFFYTIWLMYTGVVALILMIVTYIISIIRTHQQ